MSSRNISFILHKPQLSENIGACARAIKNFNFNKLLIIDPKPNFPNDKILATSVGAKDIVKKTKVFSSLDKSLSKIDIIDTYVYRIGLMKGNFSLSIAAGLFKGLIGFIMIMSTHFIAKKISGRGLW